MKRTTTLSLTACLTVLAACPTAAPTAAEPAAEWAALGPLVISALLILYSAPALDRRMARRYPAYRAYMRRVPSLLPQRPRPRT